MRLIPENFKQAPAFAMKNIIIRTFFAVVLFSACRGGEDSYTPPANTQAKPLIIPEAPASPLLAPAQQKLPSTNTISAPTSTAASQPIPAVTTVAKGMNPPHGQPLHRCDIAVGAPLNTPAQNQAVASKTSVNSVNAVTTPVAVTPQKVITKPGMNPPHGEPLHRCEIAVGAPLNSAPVQNKIEPLKKDTGT
jgi:hypothetical protein